MTVIPAVDSDLKTNAPGENELYHLKGTWSRVNGVPTEAGWGDRDRQTKTEWRRRLEEGTQTKSTM